MHRERHRYSAEWQKMMPSSIAAGNHHDKPSQSNNNDSLLHVSAGIKPAEKLFFSFSSKQQHNPPPDTTNLKNACCSSTPFSLDTPLIHPSHFCPVQAISALISSLSRDRRRTRSSVLAQSAPASTPSGVIRPIRHPKPRRATINTLPDRSSYPSSEWLKLTNRCQSTEEAPEELSSEPLSDASSSKASLKDFDLFDHDFDMPTANNHQVEMDNRVVQPTGRISFVSFVPGRVTDVKISIFGFVYHLHRSALVLSPYFAAMLSPNWKESREDCVPLHPEETDENITKLGFDAVLEYLYGSDVFDMVILDPLGVFAAARWLMVPEPMKLATQKLNQHLGNHNVAHMVGLFSKNYYGNEGLLVLDAAKCLLRLRGTTTPIGVWDEVPGEFVREVVGSDMFYAPSELDRWAYAVRLLDEVLRNKAPKMNLPYLDDRFLAPVPVRNTLEGVSVLEEPDPDEDSSDSDHDTFPRHLHLFPLILNHRDFFGVRPTPPALVTSAIVQALKLADLVDKANGPTLKWDPLERTFLSQFSSAQRAQVSRFLVANGLSARSSHLGDIILRHFPLLSEDKVDADIVVSKKLRGYTHYSPSHQQFLTNEDALRLGRSGLVPRPRAPTPLYPATAPFPPFRFSVNFPHPASLFERQRLSSPVFWFAGSSWQLNLGHSVTDGTKNVSLFLRRAWDKRPVSLSLDTWSGNLTCAPSATSVLSNMVISGSRLPANGNHTTLPYVDYRQAVSVQFKM
ncbi:hypothetical protein AJ79_03729 [Helicocarpus griseus UAMH5409]|uniref:BTB domain-containing protein n=1 Tax=Helicocarpus griseus UAMH5409 TaxID=1447875 RepID=A0A2B7XWZ7_9EURO|nr:hypothetical protein AJ79_03729 [Helicocarpus griseus UAMH5409]